MRGKRRLEAVRRWVGAVLHAPGIQNSEGDVMIDEIMYLVTVVFLVLMTITFVAGIAGFLWGMT